MSVTRRRFAQEFKDELCREVISTSKPIRDVAEAYGIGTEIELTFPERARLKELEREVQELKAEAQFLKKAAAYFAREQR
jgi:transposase